MKKVAIIGCGNISRVHAWALQNMEQAELVAVCDVDIEKAHAILREFAAGKAKVYTDWQKLCMSDVEVVHICTPHYLHAPMAVELLRHGKSVFMEKPCAISREQFEQLKQVSQGSTGKLGFCFQNRYNETTLAMKRMVEEGVIGDVIGARAFVTWRRDEDYYLCSQWKGKWSSEGGGALINQSIHTLDLVLEFMGKPELVKATMANHHLSGSIEVEDTMEAWIVFEGGRRACFYASNAYVSDAPIILELQGENGRITLNGSEIIVSTPQKGSEITSYEQRGGIGKSYWGCGHEACIREFYDCLEQEKDFRVGLSRVESTFDTMMQIYEVSGFKNIGAGKGECL